MIKDKLSEVQNRIEAAKMGEDREVTLIAVTKTHSPEMINEAIDAGVTDIGENKVQEILDKYDKVKPVRWHLIGHLQTNKVKYIIDKVCLIHSVDSVKLMDEIERQAEKHGIVMEILIQVNITGEETKFGIHPDELDQILKYAGTLKYVKVVGLMTILAKLDSDVAKRLHFNNIFKRFVDISSNKYDNVVMKYLSMGMSGDFEMAVECGSNMVRVGSAIFGDREYK
ncbi:MAG: YggS family pyridoxal phosphate-dependent enzyme [Clostridia bacterium]|nr:YggS family pyridoxal phosphate-dependent enzyme [Clostridia bacterium]